MALLIQKAVHSPVLPSNAKPPKIKSKVEEPRIIQSRARHLGTTLAILYTGFSMLVAVTTYYLTSIANKPTYKLLHCCKVLDRS